MDLEALKRSITDDNAAVQQLQQQLATQRRKLASSRWVMLMVACSKSSKVTSRLLFGSYGAAESVCSAELD